MVDIVNVGWTCTRWVTLHVRIRPCIDYYCLCLNLQDSFWKADGSLERLKTLTGLRSKSHRSLTYGMACSSCRLLCNPEEENMYLPELLCSSQDTEAYNSLHWMATKTHSRFNAVRINGDQLQYLQSLRETEMLEFGSDLCTMLLYAACVLLLCHGLSDKSICLTFKGLGFESQLVLGFFCGFNCSLSLSITDPNIQTQQFRMYSAVKLLEICSCACTRMQCLWHTVESTFWRDGQAVKALITKTPK